MRYNYITYPNLSQSLYNCVLSNEQENEIHVHLDGTYRLRLVKNNFYFQLNGLFKSNPVIVVLQKLN